MKQEIVEPTNAELVEQIHYEFDVAGDSLLSEAQSMLKNDKSVELSAKAGRLSKLGFGASKAVKESAEYTVDRIEAEKNASLITEYKESYPLNKFIDEKSIERICKKFGIVKGKVEWFIGEVPEKNLQEIENFKVRDEDSLWLRPSDWSFTARDTPVIIAEVLVDYSEHYSNEMQLGRELDKTSSIIRSMDAASRPSPAIGYTMPPSRGIIGAMTNLGMFNPVAQDSFGSHPGSYKKALLNIVAPITDFDVERFDLEKTGYDLTKKVEDAPKFDFNWLLDDPIVLQPVKGGYLIVSAWGDEASDPDVMNEINN